MQVITGYLFKIENVEYQNKQYRLYKACDYIVGILFENTRNDKMVHVITGEYAGPSFKYFDTTICDGYVVFATKNISASIEENGNVVSFPQIRKKYFENLAGKYYNYVNEKEMLTRFENEEVIDYLERSQKKSKFSEEELEENKDISVMYRKIKKTIISQDEPIMQILTALFKNQHVINSDLDDDIISKLKENVMIYGSTGTGKTEILKRISKFYDIPIVIQDATSLSETGYSGRNITDMLEDLCAEAGGNIRKAEKGILVIDEFDKLAEKESDNQTHVSRTGVQRSLLKLLDGSTFYLRNGKFDTSKLTVVALGAFTGIVQGDNYDEVTTDHFIKYGIMRELIGRFPKAIPMNQLKKDDIIKILKESDFSPLNTYEKLFEMLNVKFEYSEEFVEYIAELAIKKQSGARSLKIVFDNCISSALFRIFAGEYSSISLIKPKDESDKPYVLTKSGSDE